MSHDATMSHKKLVEMVIDCLPYFPLSIGKIETLKNFKKKTLDYYKSNNVSVVSEYYDVYSSILIAKLREVSILTENTIITNVLNNSCHPLVNHPIVKCTCKLKIKNVVYIVKIKPIFNYEKNTAYNIKFDPSMPVEDLVDLIFDIDEKEEDKSIKNNNNVFINTKK